MAVLIKMGLSIEIHHMESGKRESGAKSHEIHRLLSIIGMPWIESSISTGLPRRYRLSFRMIVSCLYVRCDDNTVSRTLKERLKSQR